MKRYRFTLIALLISLLFIQCSAKHEPEFSIESEEKNPWTHIKFRASEEIFHFAIVGDRAGGLRPGVFKNAVVRLNALNPAFVMSVGDLIDTGDFRLSPDIFDEKIVKESAETLQEKLEQRMQMLVDQGIDKQTLLLSSLITPSCATSNMSEELSAMAFRYTGEISLSMREKHFV